MSSRTCFWPPRWLIAQGRDAFHTALRDPDSMAEWDCCKEGAFEFEDIMGAAAQAYFRKLDVEGRPYNRYFTELDKHPLPNDLRREMEQGIVYDKDIDVKWDRTSLKKVVPKIHKSFGWL